MRLSGAALAAAIALLGPGLSAHADEGGNGAESVAVTSDLRVPADAMASDAAVPDAVAEVDAGDAAPAPQDEQPAAEPAAVASEPEPAPASPGQPAEAPEVADVPEPVGAPEVADAPEMADETGVDTAPLAQPAQMRQEAAAGAASATAADAGDLPHLFVVSVHLVDAAGDPVDAPYPADFDWTLTATGPTTYTSDTVVKALTAPDPTPGAYALDISLNAAAAAQLSLTELQCNYQEQMGSIEGAEFGIQYQQNGDWYVDVRPAFTTACVYIYEVTGPLPDPYFAFSSLHTQTGEDVAGDPAHVGQSSDWVLTLVDADGAVAGSVVEGGRVQVPAGEYTPRLVASATAQPGFDASAWRMADWNCGSGQSGPYGSTVRLEPGQTLTCNIVVTDAEADLATGIAHSSEVQLGWNGVYGAVGTEFDMHVRVSNLMAGFSGTAIDDLRLRVTLSDNVELVDPQVVPAGWRLESVEGAVYTYVPTAAFALGTDTTLTFRARLTAGESSRPVEACATTARIDLDRQNDCTTLATVADGGPDTDPDPDPEPEPEPEPEAEPSTKPSPNPTKAPAPASVSDTADADDALALTGGGVDSALLAGAAGALLLGTGGALIAARRRSGA